MNLYVASIGRGFTHGELLRLLGQFGEVSGALGRLPHPNRTLFGAFVSMPNRAEAYAAIMGLRMQRRDGRRFLVYSVGQHKARPSPPADGDNN